MYLKALFLLLELLWNFSFLTVVQAQNPTEEDVMGQKNRWIAIALSALVMAGLIGACANDSPSETGLGAADSGGDAFDADEAPARHGVANYDMAATGTTTGGSAGSGGGSVGLAGSLSDSPAIGPSVIKTAHVDLEVDKDGLDDATRDAISIAGRHGGFVLSTATSDDRRAAASVVVRIPSDSFERALADLEALGDVQGEKISGEDVSQEFVDMEARVRNLEAQETVLLRLMDRSVSVSDTIKVQRELQGVQLEIERLTGRLRYLKDQTDMGTISMAMTEVGAPAHKPPSGVISKAWARAVDVAMGVVAAVIIGTGFLIPVAILAAIGFLALRALRPRFSSPS